MSCKRRAIICKCPRKTLLTNKLNADTGYLFSKNYARGCSSMTTRVAVHVIAFAVLSGVGLWIAYRAVIAPMRIGPLQVDVELAAIYWFALLSYAFVVLMLYYPLRKRAWWMLLIGHVVAGTIAVVGTATVVALGHEYAAQQGAPAANLRDPSAQALPLPPEKGQPRDRQQRFEGNQL